MHIAAQNPHATKYLVKVLAEINSKAARIETPTRKFMPLHLAIQQKAPEDVVIALLKVYPGAAKAIFEEHQTVLHETCRCTLSPSCVRATIKMNPNAVEVQDKHGNLPLHIAVAYKAPADVIAILLEKFPGGAMVKNLLQNVPL